MLHTDVNSTLHWRHSVEQAQVIYVIHLHLALTLKRWSSQGHTSLVYAWLSSRSHPLTHRRQSAAVVSDHCRSRSTFASLCAAHESVSPTGSVCWRHDTSYVRPSITALCNLTRHIARQQFVSTPSSVHHRHWWRHYPQRDHKEQMPQCQKKNYDTTQRQDCSLLRHYFHPIYFNFQKYGKTDVT